MKVVPRESRAAREAFRTNLNKYMALRGFEQSTIVSQLKFSTSTVSDWVTGKKYPRVDAMQQLADLLGVNMSDLTASQSDTQADTDEIMMIREQLRRTPSVRILFDMTKNATVEDIEKTVKIMQTLKGEDE